MTFGLEMSAMMHDIYYLFDNILSDSTSILEFQCIIFPYNEVTQRLIQRSEINETFIFTTLPPLYTIQLMPYLPHLS